MFRAALLVPPIVVVVAVLESAIPAPLLGRMAVPFLSVPMKLPCTRFPEPPVMEMPCELKSPKGLLLAEITFRAAGVVPPMMLPGPFTATPTRFPNGAVSAASVPIKQPSMRLLPLPLKSMPRPGKPLIARPRTTEFPAVIARPLAPEVLPVPPPLSSTRMTALFPLLRVFALAPGCCK